MPIAPAGLAGQRLGGLDFGYRNPFAAVWGTLDGDDVLWLTGERYERGKPLSYHARHLPRDVCWYGDPAAAEQRAEVSYARHAGPVDVHQTRWLRLAAASGRSTVCRGTFSFRGTFSPIPFVFSGS